jgi:hypothetical protein
MPRLSTVLTGLSIGAAAALMVLVALASDLGAYRPAAMPSTHSGPIDHAASTAIRTAVGPRLDGRSAATRRAVGGRGPTLIL